MNLPLLKSLRLQMPLLVLAGVVPAMLVAIIYASDRASETIRREAYENMALKGQLLAESVTSWDESNVLALENLARQPDIVSMNPQEQKQILVKLVETYDHFYLALTLDPNGKAIARNDNLQLRDYSDRNYFKRAINGQKIAYQTLIGRTNNKLALCMAGPINNQIEVEKVIGVAVVCTDLETISKQVGKLRFGETGYAFVVDRNGVVIAHPNPNFISGEELRDLSDYPPVRNILTGNSGNFPFIDESGSKWFSFDLLLDNGWGIVVLQREEDLFRNEKEFQKIAFIVAGTAAFVVSILTIILADRIVRPISNLTEAAIIISQGQLNRKVDIKRSDELGILARSFNRMANQLKTSFEKLEDRVAERTKELKIAKESAEQANLTKDRFLANISHELRTPLNSILGYTQIIRRDRNLSSQHQKRLKIVHKSGTHLLTLINDLLDVAKADSLKMKLYPRAVDFPKFLQETIAMVSSPGIEKGLNVFWEDASFLPNIVEVDEKRLRQVLINLLNNAIKFTHSGEVKLKVSAIDSSEKASTITLCFEVIDTGVGMSPEQLEKIFQPFEQVGDTKSRSAGTGLGLHISKQLVELMGGSLEVESTLGSGSKFWFELTLPVRDTIDKGNVDRVAKSSNILGYKGDTRRLLIVDDKAENLNFLTEILEPIGFEIFTASNGQDMLNIASSIRPDLFLLDLHMPVKTGFTSAKELRQMPEFKHTPIFILSASYITDSMRQYLECDLYLSKPVDEEKLLKSLQKYLHLEWIYPTLE